MKKFCYLLLIVILASCERREQSVESNDQQDDNPQVTEILSPLEVLIDKMIAQTTEKRILDIRSAPNAESTVDHFGVGLSLRNGEMNRSDSAARAYLVKKGIFARDDLSSIILVSYARKIRDEPIDIDAQVSFYRDYWAAKDLIAPLNISCPTCNMDMEVHLYGRGVSKDYPETEYFGGICPEEHEFLYYHKEGWIPRP